MNNENEQLLAFFKALADPNRLKMLGLLAQHAYSGEELAALLGLKASTVSHHLSRLTQAGLISAHAEGYYNIYKLEESALRKIQTLFPRADLSSAAAGVDLDSYDRKVVRDFSHPDGSLKEIPAQRKKLEAILRYILREFEPGRRYPEALVNQMLAHFHPDTATLRRELVATHLMDREGGGGAYWRTEEKTAPQGG